MSQPAANGREEDSDFNDFLTQFNQSGGNIDLNFSEDLGEKADDAIDYEDIEDDDDLPEEEVAKPRPGKIQQDEEPLKTVAEDDRMDALFDGEPTGEPWDGDNLDDLFGEGGEAPSSTPETATVPDTSIFAESLGLPVDSFQSTATVQDTNSGVDTAPQPSRPASPSQDMEDMDPATFKEYQLQQALFAMSGYGPENLPPPPENHEELLASLWPKFSRDEMPRFLELLPPKKSHYIGKQPPKPPKKIVPSKLHLEIAQDQERSFRSNGPPPKRGFEPEHSFLISIAPPAEDKGPGGLIDFSEDVDEELPGGVTMQDLEVLCADWTLPTPPISEDEREASPANADTGDGEMVGEDWLFDDSRQTKKRKTGKSPLDFVSYSHVDIPFISDPLEATKKLSETVNIDMNDPFLLLDELSPTTLKASHTTNRTDMSGGAVKRMIKRYNISNDEAYDMLKENHQNKIRSTLGNVAIEHSLPAARLQWPYYKTKLARQEARSFHRPALTFMPNIPNTFKKPANVKRKHQKGKDAKSMFDTTKSLSLADNSHVLLVEYSEEHPTMLSNFGMGSRVVNYYRRKNMEDPSRPKADIGETAVLLPQDKSPYSIFGHIDPGEVSTALVTGMFRAPLFRQQVKPTDFLVIRNSTGIDGSAYFMKMIENMFVAGQQFPSVDVPGPHSRKVTTAAKNRLKMICYRLIKRNKHHRVSVSDITEHFPDSNDMQNRQKMKEFLQFSKDHKEWEMRPGEPIPDEDVLRGYVKPEDVCLLESMQVGQQHLHDAGYDKEDEEGEDDDNKEGESLEQQLAPWKTTRNFMLASQGKAMLQLHGEGDPTGRGEGFSFIKTSMKGGFKAIGESVEDKLDAQRLKELGGHSYNVARQQKSYEDSIRRVWEAQKSSLSTTIENSDEESDIDRDEPEEREISSKQMRSARPTPSFGRRDDETGSQFSRFSTSSQSGKIMRIRRQIRNAHGEIEEVPEIVKDPRVIKQYQKQRHEAELRNLTYVMSPTVGNKWLT